MQTSIYVGLGISLGCLFGAIAAHAPPECEFGDKSTYEVHEVVDTTFLRTGPLPDATRVINRRASEALGSTEHHQIDKSVRVRKLCAFGEWAKVRIVKPAWLSDGTGWVQQVALGKPRQLGANVSVTSDKISWDADSSPHQTAILRALTKLQDEEPACRDGLVGASLAKSTAYTSRLGPVFLIECDGEFNKLQPKVVHFPAP